MPNGISCAYFAARNFVYGKKEENVFKEGIAGAQTARTIDTVTRTGVLRGTPIAPAKGIFSKAAAIARKIVYPLIIASGIYNTAKSDDKVKTGISQASGIATMYTFEQLAEKGLNTLNKKLMNTNFAQNHKLARIGIYVAKGAAFAAASLSGYSAGSKGAEHIVDKIRKTDSKISSTPFDTMPFPIDKDLSEENIDGMLFEDMKL